MKRYYNKEHIKEFVTTMDGFFDLIEEEEPTLHIINCDNCGKEQGIAEWIYQQNIRNGGLQLQCPCGDRYK